MIRSPPLIIPSINDIRFAPERAALVLLQAALVIAANAVTAERPTAVARDDPRIFGRSGSRIALSIRRADRFARALLCRRR